MSIFEAPQYHSFPSLAVSPQGAVSLAWLGFRRDLQPTVGDLVLIQSFPFGENPVQMAVPTGPKDIVEFTPSIGAADAVEEPSVAFARTSTIGSNGLFARITDDAEAQVRPCGAICYTSLWRPSLQMDAAGYTALTWAEAETAQVDAPFNIALRLYAPDGALIDEIAGPG